MTFKKAIIFDFDGVIADTEPLYDVYMNDVGVRYSLGIENLATLVKGIPTKDLLTKYFGHLDSNTIDKFNEEMFEFELTMDIPPITGALEFISYLKKKNYPIALVTSSHQAKMTRALSLLGLHDIFDTEVTANRITRGKPDPMCFELAAKDLGVKPEDCIVFEDSIHGINAANAANMKVIGLTTSFRTEEIEDLVIATLSDFSDLDTVISLLN